MRLKDLKQAYSKQLLDTFSIWSSYGMRINIESLEFELFNRKYKPIGYAQPYTKYIVYETRNDLVIENLKLCANNHEKDGCLVQYNTIDGQVYLSIFFYNDATNPFNSGETDEILLKKYKNTIADFEKLLDMHIPVNY